MRKSIVIILAVAIIGALGIYGKSSGNNPAMASPSSSRPAASTTSQSSNSVANASTPAPASSASTGAFKDGTYTGNSEDTSYGTVQIAVVVSGGKITNINFLQMPSDRGYSQEVTSVAGPMLKQETIQKQSSHIDFVSGATSTSEGYLQSLQSAINQAS